MNSEREVATGRRAGRPRNRLLDREILEAASGLLEEVGYDGLTIEAVARRAGVSRPTVYRRWDDKSHLVVAVLGRSWMRSTSIDTGSLRNDLLAIHREQARLFASAPFRHVAPTLIARFGRDEALATAYAEEFVDMRRRMVATALDLAAARGEITRHVDVDDAFDLLTGPLFYRVVVGRGRATRRLASAAVDAVMALARVGSSAASNTDTTCSR